ncbi:MAG: aspartate aminotransferase family protein [Planctomycetota bacterium]|nr:MAG: aspartate aminotransferase family protein [Planctomycetota bacterium]
MTVCRTTPQLVTELPGPKAREVLERDEQFVSTSYTRDYPFVAEKGSGCWVEDVDGNSFLDFAAGIAVCATGHCHPRVVEAIQDQAGKLLHMSGTDFYHTEQAQLAERLARTVPWEEGGRVFFGNSGTEANECALKLMRWHTQRQIVVSFEGAFHGRTYGSLSLTASKPVHKERFFPMLPGVYHVPYGDAAAIERLLGKVIPESDFAGIFVEALQGEGGYLLPPAGFMQQLREICDRSGALLVCDEVQAGMGRTGKLWCFEHEDVLPDIVTTAKGIASGMPLGACIARRSVMDWTPGSHASTFGGNPVACCAALATMDLLEGGLTDNAAENGAYMRELLDEKLGENPHVLELRGRGFMLAVELDSAELRDRVVNECFYEGLLILGCGVQAVRFSPPLTLSRDEVETGVEIFVKVLARHC